MRGTPRSETRTTRSRLLPHEDEDTTSAKNIFQFSKILVSLHESQTIEQHFLEFPNCPWVGFPSGSQRQQTPRMGMHPGSMTKAWACCYTGKGHGMKIMFRHQSSMSWR
ncbi:hypothetical protein EJB05_14758 [Eragrostis curvula]|uniref:Uncharacterized protein n=1 Tax=Eragrostis curvula TaxID=38414 RepID=A0A5J9W035_9POAL|nr:hypothetical protein EJB05_14758 [Eragrostis curvula]